MQWRAQGVNRHAYGPRRGEKQTAKEDLEIIRAAAEGKTRRDGFAAMEAEAKRLGRPRVAPGTYTFVFFPHARTL